MQSQVSEFKPLLRLAAPIAFSYMANYFMQIVDTLFVGHLGAAPLGGVSLGSGLFAIVMVVAIGLLLGLDFRVSHAFGSKNLNECQKLLVHGLYLSVLLSIPLTALLVQCSNHFGFFGITPDVSGPAGDFLRVLSFSLLPLLLFTACRQYLQAMGTAGPILMIFIAANAVNALFDWMFIYGHWGVPAMGVVGAAYSTLVARTLMFIALFAYTLKRNHRLQLSFRKAGLRFQHRMIRDLLGLGLPASGQLVLEVGVFVTATFLIGRLGAVPLAAHQIVLQIASFTFMVPQGISAATAVVVGQALGARHISKAIRLGWHAIALSTGIMACFGISLFVFSQQLMGAFTTEAPVIAIARQLILLAALFQIVDGAQVVVTGALRGVGNTRASMIANFLGHWMVGIPIGLTLCFVAHWGAIGIWVGLTVGLAIVAAILLCVWRKAVARLDAPLVAQENTGASATAVI